MIKVVFVVSVKKSWIAFLGLVIPCCFFIGCSSDSGEVVIPDKAPPEMDVMGAGAGDEEDLGDKPPGGAEL